MSTYKLIIKNIIRTDINFFSLDYKEYSHHIKWYIKFIFLIILDKEIDIKNKYKIFFELLNNFLIKDKKDEFIDYFCKIQKTYNILNRLIYNYKYKKTKIVVNTDMCLNELTENEKNVICILDNNYKFLFNINDLINIINTSLTNSYLFISQPKSIKNPYNNLPFNKSTLYNIYFFIKFKTNYYPELFFKFFNCNFNLNIFKYFNENLLRDYSIENYVYKSPYNIIEQEIRESINIFNFYCEKYMLKNRIYIHKDFPQKKLVEVMRPYLFLYCKSQYSFHQEMNIRYNSYFNSSMIRFSNFNPFFGRKKVKILYKVNKYFKKKKIGKEITFNDKFIKFCNLDKLNDLFLIDHLKYDENINFYTSNNFNIYYEEDEEEYNEDDNDDDDEDHEQYTDNDEEDEDEDDEQYADNDDEEEDEDNDEEHDN
jgi:hypothetical protein